MKVIVSIFFLLLSVMGLLTMIGLGLAYFLPSKEKEENINIEVKREDEED